MNNLHIVADENLLGVTGQFPAFATIEQRPGRDISAANLTHADVLLVRSVTRVNEELLDDSRVRFVGTATSGFDHVDRDYLQSRDIGFAHAPGSNANSVVEYVLCAIAHCGQKLEQLLAAQGSVGIVGYGVIGRTLMTRLLALGIDCIAYDPWLGENTSTAASASLDDILSCSVISLHAELTRQSPWPSYHLIGCNELQKMSHDSLFINASRGAVVDNAALSARLDSGQGPLSVLDVWEGEPAISTKLLQQVALGTAHIAGYSLDGKYLATRMLGDALRQHLRLSVNTSHSHVQHPGVLNLPANLSGAGLVRHLLHCRYSIAADDANLRKASLSVAESEVANGFDALRRNYAPRRELKGSVVEVPPLTPSDLALVRGLGCIPAICESTSP